MAEGPPALFSSTRQALQTALALGAAGAWLVVLNTAWVRWNALSFGPICGEANGELFMAGHCPACPLAVALTMILALTLIWPQREPRVLARP
uniref:Uncharacterized protein n=1 Tax=Caulobacter sp. (strain K31) TaxID=366602 RepID=B0SVU5_CAUSK